jgi:pentatricopeptide repeat protein
MNNAGIHSDRGSTRSIFLALKRSRSLAAVAVDALFSLRAKHEIPISAFNVVIEGLCETGASEKAIELYHDVRRLCSSVPNVHTFEPLFERCTELQTAEFLASEMSAFNIRPSRLIYDQLVYLFALDGDIETAFRHLWEMGRIAATTGVGKTAESWVTRRTAVALLKRCVAIKDERAWDLFDAAKRRGMDLAREIDSPITAPMVNAGDKPSLSVETPPPRAEIDVSPVSTAVAYRA